MSPSVQVQIVTYNSEHCISQCIDGVLDQTYVISSIVVVDNASRDDTVLKLKGLPISVDVVQLEKNVGYATAHNIGFRIAMEKNIDFVLTLNPDVMLDSHYVAELIKSYSAKNEVLARLGGMTGKLLRTESKLSSRKIIDSTGLQMELFYHVRDRGAEQPDVGQYDVQAEVWGICGAAAVYNVEMLRNITMQYQVFDESFFVYKEDVDLCWRANRNGWCFIYVPNANAFHVRGWKEHAKNKIPKHALTHSFANQIALLIAHVPCCSLYLIVTLWVESIRFLLMCVRAPHAGIQVIRLLRSNWEWMWHKRQELKRDCREEGRGIYL